MEMERRGTVIQYGVFVNNHDDGKMNEEKTKSFAVSREMVRDSYQKVSAKQGSAGIDEQSIEMFNEHLEGNLYKLWNRLSSGSYFPPPVRTVMIAKKQGGERPLGIPTVTDRIAQGVVKDYLEKIVEPLFSNGSYGYRPGRSAHQALEQCEAHCHRHDWVLDLDIRNFFEALSHEWMMKMVTHHTQEKWVLLYTERWLKAGIGGEDGSVVARTKGTPQGGVISPLLANLYLHHAFDKWMERYFPNNPFERYADDIIIHCKSRQEAEGLLETIRERLMTFDLELHPEKTKLVYCKDDRRKGDHEVNSFTFLGYSFQPRERFNRSMRRKFVGFGGAISNRAKANIREVIRATFNPRYTQVPMSKVVARLNLKIRGWIQYYGKLCSGEVLRVFLYVNQLVRRWVKVKMRLQSWKSIRREYEKLVQERRGLFYHWTKGVTY